MEVKVQNMLEKRYKIVSARLKFHNEDTTCLDWNGKDKMLTISTYLAPCDRVEVPEVQVDALIVTLQAMREKMNES